MTVAVYDGVSIAADRQITAGTNIVGFRKKIEAWTRGDWVSCGAETDNRQFIRWLENGRIWKPGKEFQAIYTDEGTVYAVNRDLAPWVSYFPWGIGSGGEAAETLCRVGYTAEEACKEVIQFDTNCGGKIDVVSV